MLFLEGTLPKTGDPVMIMSKTQMLLCSTSTPNTLPPTKMELFTCTQMDSVLDSRFLDFAATISMAATKDGPIQVMKTDITT